MRATRTLTISTTGAGVLTVYVSLPAKGYTGSMVTLSTYWSGVAGGPLDGDTVGVISWGDGTSDTISMPIASTNYSISHTYSTTGTKAVKNVVTDPYAGATGTGTTSITIAAPLSIASFTASPTSGAIPLAVTFTIGTISGGYTPYTGTLAYGDGASDPVSAAGTKSHTYTTKGTFTATLTITDALGATVFSRLVTYAGVTIPACPIWMNALHTFAKNNGLKRLQQGLEAFAESRKCSLT